MTTTTPQRADPFELADLDVSGFAPAAAPKKPAAPSAVRIVSEDNNFPSRAPKQRRRRTGRNVQVNIKATQETIDKLTTISDQHGWVFGETLEYALAALEKTSA